MEDNIFIVGLFAFLMLVGGLVFTVAEVKRIERDGPGVGGDAPDLRRRPGRS